MRETSPCLSVIPPSYSFPQMPQVVFLCTTGLLLPYWTPDRRGTESISFSLLRSERSGEWWVLSWKVLRHLGCGERRGRCDVELSPGAGKPSGSLGRGMHGPQALELTCLEKQILRSPDVRTCWEVASFYLAVRVLRRRPWRHLTCGSWPFFARPTSLPPPCCSVCVGWRGLCYSQRPKPDQNGNGVGSAAASPLKTYCVIHIHDF